MSSADFIRRLDALRQEFATWQGHGTRFAFDFNEEDVLDLASGYVPDAIKAMCLAALDWSREDQRRADRPLKVTHRKSARQQ